MPAKTAKILLSKRALLKIPDIEKKIGERMDDLLEAMLDLALGHYSVSHKFNTETGQIEAKIYTVDPDYKALAFLMENFMGKTPQRLEITGDGGGPIKIIPYMTMGEAQRMKLIEAPEDEDDADTDEEESIAAEFTDITAALNVEDIAGGPET